MKKTKIDLIEKSFLQLGISKNLETNPQMVQSVLKEMKLDDFKTNNKLMNNFFQESVSKPQKLQPMFKIIKEAIVSKHPAIIEFIDLAILKNWFKPSEHIIRSVHVAYILEALTVTMCNNHKFFLEVQKHYKNKEQMMGLNALHFFKTFVNALKLSSHFFDLVKPFSVDPLLVYFKFQRGLSKSKLTKKDLKKLYKNDEINYIEYRLLLPMKENHIQHINELVRINIYEAGIIEYKNGIKSNAICAHELSEDLKINPPSTIFKKKIVVPEKYSDSFYDIFNDKENLFPVISVNQNWTSLYTSWNMAFVLGNLEDLDLIFPKLLIPSIIDAKSNNFLGVRFISLWLTINFAIFRKYEKKEIIGPSNKIEMAKAWSDINKKYAFNLAKKETHEDSKILKRYYNRFFSHPFWGLFKLVKNF